MALEDLTPFGTLPKAYQGLLGVDETAALQKRAQIQGLLGAGLALAKGMSAYGPPRSALQNILGAVAGGFESAGGAYQGGIKQRMDAQQMLQQQRTLQGAEQLKLKYPELAQIIDTNLPGAMRIIADMEQEKRQPKLTSAKPGEVLVDPTGKVVYQAAMGERSQGGVLTKEEAAALGLPSNVIYQKTADGKIMPVEGTGAKAPEVREFADGTTRQWDGQKWSVVARKPVGEGGAAKQMYERSTDAQGNLVWLPKDPFTPDGKARPVLDASGRPIEGFKAAVKNVQLPAAIQKQEDEDYDRGQTAINLANDSNKYINAIRSGAIPFGPVSSVSASVRGALGSNSPDVIAKKDFEAFKVRIINERLRLNKGTQTDTDAKRAIDELQAANSATGAAKAINTLMEINLRDAQDAQNSITRRRKNSKLGDPEVLLDVPKFEPHTFTQADVNNLMRDPKYPKGTIFVDPEGVRRVKQ
jgi:hypothetical protein